MPYADHFKLTDDLIAHLNPVVTSLSDPFLVSRYTGFVAVAAVTVYELAVKEIFCSFGESKHIVLGNFTRIYFDRINGRIKYKNLHEDYIFFFGEKYVNRFKKTVAKREKEILLLRRIKYYNKLSKHNNMAELVCSRRTDAHERHLFGSRGCL
jgi:hypothetical protein